MVFLSFPKVSVKRFPLIARNLLITTLMTFNQQINFYCVSFVHLTFSTYILFTFILPSGVKFKTRKRFEACLSAPAVSLLTETQNDVKHVSTRLHGSLETMLTSRFVSLLLNFWSSFQLLAVQKNPDSLFLWLKWAVLLPVSLRTPPLPKSPLSHDWPVCCGLLRGRLRCWWAAGSQMCCTCDEMHTLPVSTMV